MGRAVPRGGSGAAAIRRRLSRGRPPGRAVIPAAVIITTAATIGRTDTTAITATRRLLPVRLGPELGFGFGYPYGYAGGYWGYPYGGYAYGYPGYAAATYGGVKIENAPPDAAVYADGYYVGTVDDFNGSFQKLNLEPGAHHIEVMRPAGAPPASVDVNIRAGQTVTFRAN